MIPLAEKKFVIFDAAQIDVNSIVALAYQLQDSQGLDTEGKPIPVRAQVAVIMLDNGSSVTLGGSSLEKFEHWWKANVTAEKVDLPAVVPDAVAAANSKPAPAAPPAPVAPTAPAPAPAQAPIDPVAPAG